MKKILSIIAILLSSLVADFKEIMISEDFLNRDIKIINIRTQSEWQETGIIEGAYTLTFFNEQGRFDEQSFIRSLESIVTKDEEFALVCRTGSRTKFAGNLLSQKYGYKVISLNGGMSELIKEDYETIEY
ncbi:MAG: rhodanese-like domain-containing protein [Campylobacterales bacterium]|nr:rhodanese-like domain-containing protein [Campylobacterales bacterium]